jgi:ABC-type nitrate/sulfonate/bicarbonate transport system permease component
MAVVGEVGSPGSARARLRLSVRQTQIATLAALLLLWQAAGDSGWFYKGVFPSVLAIAKALAQLLVSPDFYQVQLATTAYEVGVAFAIGASTGLAAGLVLGASRYAGESFEPILYYVAPTPKIVFLPVLLVLFGVGPGSKIALGALSCFFPMALSVASGVRQINPTLLKVGRSLRMSRAQALTKIYLPALRPPIGSGLRISFGLAVVGCILAELKLSDAGLGFLALDYYRQYEIAPMFAVVVVVFGLAAAGNVVLGRLASAPGPHRD